MTNEAAWTEKFDRWWAERKLHPVGDSLAIRETCRAAFMAGAAAERAEHAASQMTPNEQAKAALKHSMELSRDYGKD